MWTMIKRKRTGDAVPDLASGQAALVLVLVVGSIVLIAGLTLLFLVISLTNSIFGLRAANRALGVANAGAEDVMLRVVRDIGFDDCATACTIPIGNDAAKVTVENNYAGNVDSTIIIESEGSVLSAKRKVRTVLSVDSTGRVTVVSRGQVVF